MILLGAIGTIVSWQETRKVQMGRLKALCDFYHRAHYAFEAEKMHCIDFFETYQTEEKVLKKTMEILVSMLRLHTYPTGETAWRAAFSSMQEEWGLKKEGWEIVIASGKSFFGKNLSENLEQMEVYQNRMQEQIALEEQDFREKRKVFMPVGLLGGIMLIIILI